MRCVAVTAGPPASSRIGLDEVRQCDAKVHLYWTELRQHIGWPRQCVQMHLARVSLSVERVDDVLNHEGQSISGAPRGSGKIRHPHSISAMKCITLHTCGRVTEAQPHRWGPPSGMDDESPKSLGPQGWIVYEDRCGQVGGLGCRGASACGYGQQALAPKRPLCRQDLQCLGRVIIGAGRRMSNIAAFENDVGLSWPCTTKGHRGA